MHKRLDLPAWLVEISPGECVSSAGYFLASTRYVVAHLLVVGINSGVYFVVFSLFFLFDPSMRFFVFVVLFARTPVRRQPLGRRGIDVHCSTSGHFCQYYFLDD